DLDRAFGPRFEAKLGPPRKPGAPFELDGKDRRFADIARSAQDATEEVLLGLARKARAATGARSLCLAGGVAHNAGGNARIAREAGFDAVYVHPAAGDAGGALGAALLSDPPRAPARLASAAIGLRAHVDEALALAAELGLSAERVGDPA